MASPYHQVLTHQVLPPSCWVPVLSVRVTAGLYDQLSPFWAMPFSELPASSCASGFSPLLTWLPHDDPFNPEQCLNEL